MFLLFGLLYQTERWQNLIMDNRYIHFLINFSWHKNSFSVSYVMLGHYNLFQFN